MSNEATSWAVRQDAGSSGAKLLLMVVANHSGKDGVSYPGQKLLARECNFKRTETVGENFARLEAFGLVRRLERRRESGSRTSDWCVLAPGAVDRGDMLDATSEQPSEVVAVAKRGAESGRPSPADSASDPVDVTCGKPGTSPAENRVGHLRKTGGPEPSEEPSEEPSVGATATQSHLVEDDRSPSRGAESNGSGGTHADLEPFDAGRHPLCDLLADLIVENGSKRPPITEGWVTAERLLLTRDGRPREQAEQLIRWCQCDGFWRSNVLSMPTFRARYDQLRLRSQGGAARESPSDLLRAMGFTA